MDGCPTDAQLAAHIDGHTEPRLADHLDHCPTCSTVVVALVKAESPSPVADDVLGRYRLVRELGRGGMGVVFLAHDLELDRAVAIKVVRRGGRGEVELDARLRRESRLLARIRHPSVITVYDVGRHEDHLYVAMELIDGLTLSRWLAARTRSWQQIVDVIYRAALGLAAAHDAGVLHRDVKPDNLLVEEQAGHVTRVVITDFGVARLAPTDEATQPAYGAPSSSVDGEPSRPEGMPSPSPDGSALTFAGSVPGTLAYMAPEQLDGTAIDARADVFSLAVTAWEALFGRRPFVGGDRHARRAAIDAGPARPQDARTQPPARVEHALRRALAARPDLRTPSVHELASDLRATRAQRRWIAAAGASAIAAIAVATAIVATRTNRTDRACSFDALDHTWPIRRAAAHVSGIEGLPARIDAMAAAWRTQRHALCKGRTADARVATESVDCLDRWAGQLAAELDTLAPAAPLQPILLADVGVCRSAAAGVLQLYVPDAPAQRSAIQALRRRIAARVADPRVDLDELAREVDARGLAGLRGELALARARTTRGEQREDLLREIAASAERDGDPLVAATAWLDLIETVLARAPDAARANDQLATADVAIRSLGDPIELRAAWHGADARTAALAGDPARVRRASDAIARLAPLDDHPPIAAARALFDVGDQRAALAMFAAIVDKRAAGGATMVDAKLRGYYGSALLEAGHAGEARTVLAEGVAIASSLDPQGHVAGALALDLARALVAAGKLDEALAELDRAAPLLTGPEATTHTAANFHEHRAYVLGELGRRADSLAAMRAAVGVWTAASHADPKSVAIARMNLGAMLTEHGDHAEALAVTRGAIEDLSAAIGDANPYCANGYSTMGEILTRLGRRTDARAAFERALAIYGSISADPGYVALAKRGLAMVLPPLEHGRARALASEALAAWRERPDAWRAEIIATEAWLARR